MPSHGLRTTPTGSLFAAEIRARALDVLGDTDSWSEADWQRNAILLASAVVAAADDLHKVMVPVSRELVAELSADWSDLLRFRIEDGEFVFRRDAA